MVKKIIQYQKIIKMLVSIENFQVSWIENIL